MTIAGPSLAPGELAVRKTLALFGRAEPRDFVDVYMLHRSFNRDETLREAAESDQGFDLALFSTILRAHSRISDDQFPDVGVAIPEIRAYFDAWADHLDARFQRMSDPSPR